jgi:hypothetical protein
MLFRYPYLTPNFQIGQQVFTPGQGGPQSNLAATAAHPQSWPEMTGHCNALFVGPSFAVARPQMPVSNQYTDVSMFVEIPGLMKRPSYD